MAISCEEKPKPAAVESPSASQAKSDAPKGRDPIGGDLVRQIAGEFFGSDNIIAIQTHPSSDLVNTAFVQYRTSENLTNNLTRWGIFLWAEAFFNRIYSDKRLSSLVTCGLSPYLALKDRYGNTSEQAVGEFWLGRSLAAKINFGGLNADEFYELLGTESKCMLHPSLRDEEIERRIQERRAERHIEEQQMSESGNQVESPPGIASLVSCHRINH